jgi:septal ring factor EnvC (AmiA/AmiB activator)
MNRYIFPTIALLLFLITSPLLGQSNKLEELENRRLAIGREISQLNNYLFQGKKEQRSVLTMVEDLNYKISVRRNLISITNQQANLLTREINSNQKTISTLRDRLKILKEEYAAMVVKSYKSKSEQSRVMFLLSSNNFQQAYKRLQYIKQYAEYQKKQGEEIKIQTTKLQDLNLRLNKQNQNKQALIEDNRKVKAELEKELKEQEVLIASINKDLKKYTAQIKTKQKEIDDLDKEIDRIIKEAIAASNRKAGKSTNSTTFALTPEEKKLAASFVANKGKLPWPVEQGVVKVKFGKQRHPVVRSTVINSKGVRIATNKSAKARTVFEGVVNSIIVQKNGVYTITIQHGNYLTVYDQLSRIYVKKGDRVQTKQEIGEVRTNSIYNQTEIRFRVYKGLSPQNPSSWLYKM